MIQNIKVNPIKYELNFDEETLKNISPVYKVSSNSYSKVVKRIKKSKDNDPSKDKVKTKQREQGSVTIEVWNKNDRNPENLIGKGKVKYDYLRPSEGKTEEWIELKDRQGNVVGKALVEVEISPSNNMLEAGEDFFNRVMDDMSHMIEDEGPFFRGFGRSFLPSLEFPDFGFSRRGDLLSLME